MTLAEFHARGMLPAITQAAVRTPVADVLDSGCRVVFEYWEGLPRAGSLPAWRDFHLEDLPPRIVPYIRVVDIDMAAFDIRYRYWGTGLVRVLGHDRTGQTLSEQSVARAADALAEYKTVVGERAPFALIYDATTSKNAMPLYAPAIRLPLASDGETVDIVVAYADFGADQEKWSALLAERSQGLSGADT